jgi:hypothetical protein
VIAAAAAAALTRPQAAATVPGTPAAAGAGMRAYIDPETGQLGTAPALPAPTEEEKALLEPTQPPREVVLPDGSVMLELNGACQEFTVMQLDADGQRSVQCVQDPQTALRSPAPAARTGAR